MMRFYIFILCVVAAPASFSDDSTSQVIGLLGMHFSYTNTEVTTLDRRPPQFNRKCTQLKKSGDVKLFGVLSPDKKLFADIRVYVEKLGDGEQLINLYNRIKPPKHSVSVKSCAYVTKYPFAMIQYGESLITITGGCDDGDLFEYEVAEVIYALQTLFPDSSMPQSFLYASCGRGVPEEKSINAYLIEMIKKKSYWGKTFPRAREVAKEKLRASIANQQGEAK